MGDYSLEVHGCHTYDSTGAISQPIYLSATYRHPGFGQSTGYDYGRVANPTRDKLEQTVAELERGQRCWALSSGMAAINLIIHSFSPGDHILLSEDLYGGTVRIANDIYSLYGLEFEYVDTSDNELVAKHIRPNTKGIFIETPSNPMMLISDIAALANLAHKNNAILMNQIKIIDALATEEKNVQLQKQALARLNQSYNELLTKYDKLKDDYKETSEQNRLLNIFFKDYHTHIVNESTELIAYLSSVLESYFKLPAHKKNDMVINNKTKVELLNTIMEYQKKITTYKGKING